MIMNRFKIGWLLAIQALVGCSTPLPPQELLQARSAYNAASKSAAVQLAPAKLDHDFRNSQLDALDSSKSQLETEKQKLAAAEKARIAAEASLKELANVK